MARGWESKGIEEQQAEARASSVPSKRPLSKEDAARTRKHEGLRLQREHILKQMETAQNERYREILQAALQALDSKIAGLH